MTLFAFLAIPKNEVNSLWAMLDASPSHVLIEEAMVRCEQGGTFSDQSVGSRWIGNNTDKFKDLYPDVVQFLRDQQINPSTVHLLEMPGVAAAISQTDLIDTYRRIILRHMPPGYSWFTALYSVATDKQAAISVYLDWIDGKLRAERNDVARAFFNRYSVGELELLPNTHDFTQPINYRIVRRGSLWKLLAPDQIAMVITKIITAGHGEVVCQNWMMIRVWFIEQPSLASKLGDALVASIGDAASITTQAQYVTIASLTKRQKLAALRQLRPEPAPLQVPEGGVAHTSASFDLLLLLTLVLDGEISQREVARYDHLLASSHPIVTYRCVRQYERAAAGRHIGTWNHLATLAAASLERSVPAYGSATVYWDDDKGAYCAHVGDVVYVERSQGNTLDKRSGDEVIVPIINATDTEVEVPYLIPVK